MISLILTSILSLVAIMVALFAVMTKSTEASIIASGLVGLVASVIYILMAAPDVAMTEAAIGSGLMTAIFFIVLSRVKGRTNG